MSLNFGQFNSIVSLFNHQSKLYGEKPYLWKKSDGKYISLSWNEIFIQVQQIAKKYIRS